MEWWGAGTRVCRRNTKSCRSRISGRADLRTDKTQHNLKDILTNALPRRKTRLILCSLGPAFRQTLFEEVSSVPAASTPAPTPAGTETSDKKWHEHELCTSGARTRLCAPTCASAPPGPSVGSVGLEEARTRARPYACCCSLTTIR